MDNAPVVLVPDAPWYASRCFWAGVVSSVVVGAILYHVLHDMPSDESQY